GSNIAFRRMNAEYLQLPDKSFDFVISTENFEHLHNQGGNLREMSRVLRDDGMLLLATPNREAFLNLKNSYHTHELVYEELRHMMQECFGACLIVENLHEAPTAEGRRMKKERMAKGEIGIDLSKHPFLWEKRIDTTWISNTHSFLCFARFPNSQARPAQE